MPKWLQTFFHLFITGMLLIITFFNIMLFFEWVFYPTEPLDIETIILMTIIPPLMLYNLFSFLKSAFQYFTSKIHINNENLYITYKDFTYKWPFFTTVNYIIPIESIAFVRAHVTRIGFTINIVLDKEMYHGEIIEIDNEFLYDIPFVEEESYFLKNILSTRKVGYLSFSTHEHPKLVKHLKKVVDDKYLLIDGVTKELFNKKYFNSY